MHFKDFGGLEFSPASLDDLKRRLEVRGDPLLSPKPTLSTGSLSLDWAMGAGGLRRGEVVLLAGTSFERNITLAVAMVSAAQAQGCRVAVIEEGKAALWPALTRHAGVGEESLGFLKVDDPLAALAAARELVKLDQIDLVLIGRLSRVAAGSLEELLLRQATEELHRLIASGRTALVLLDAGRHISAATGPAGRMRKLLGRTADVQVLTRRLRPPSGRGRVLHDFMGEGGRLAVEVTGAGVPEPERVILDFAKGGTVSRSGDLLEAALAEGTIRRHGAVYETKEGVPLGRGRQAAKGMLEADGDLALSLEARVEKSMEATTPREPAEGEEPEMPREALPEPGKALPSFDRGQRGALRPLPRFLNTWFEGDAEPLLPLVAGTCYRFKFQIGPRRAERPGGRAARFAEPDFGGHEGATLLVTLYSRDFEIRQQNHTFWLPGRGESEVQETLVSPLHEGPCTLRLVVSLRQELEILQSMVVEVEAVEPPVPATTELGG